MVKILLSGLGVVVAGAWTALAFVVLRDIYGNGGR